MNSESLFNYLLKDLLHYIESRNKGISIIYIILSDLIFSSINHKKTSFTFEIFLLNLIFLPEENMSIIYFIHVISVSNNFRNHELCMYMIEK